MNRRGVFGVLIGGVVTAAATPARQYRQPPCLPLPNMEFLQKVISFEKEWNAFYRKFLGCPLEGIADRETCRVELGIADYGVFERARTAAMKLFDFKEI